MSSYGDRPANDGENLQPGLRAEDIGEVSPADTLTPSDRYQELFVAVQMQGIFKDSKTFVDCAPRNPPTEILAAYRRECSSADFDLAAFVHTHFALEESEPDCFVSDPERTLAQHIEKLWPVLTRRPKEHPAQSSLLPLPHDYVVPGGRFKELYYWDSYFTLLGFHANGHRDILRCMADNFGYLIDTYGHVPNGTRTYYLSRSQPPVFSLMVELFEGEGIRKAVDYLPHLKKEYAFWMDGADQLQPGEAHRRCVRLANGALMNRYWDDRDIPRDESYCEDVATAKRSSRPAEQVYRDIRAGAESGWDFSSRWLDVKNDLSTIRTTSMVPVDLNSLIYKLEHQIAKLAEIKGEDAVAADFHARAQARIEAINHYLWNEEQGAYFDYDLERRAASGQLTAATIVPLFVRLASSEQADKVERVVRERLLAPGGIAPTEVTDSGEQWDRPNGWAPLQWMAIEGLSNYCHLDLAHSIRDRWLIIVSALYEAEGKLVEKYILRRTTEHAHGGEYELQDGFGWTNGVTLRLLEDDPEHLANHCRALSG